MVKKVFIRLAVFLALLAILDWIVGNIVRKIYFAQDHGVYYRTTYSLERATPDIMVIGSSKASHHYIATVIEDSLKLTCFNAGRDGNFILYSNAIVNCALKRYSPKIILLDIIDDEFELKSYKTQNKLSSLLPYYKTHPEIRSIVDLKSPYERYKLLSGMYTFNTLLLPSITGMLDLNNKKAAEKTLGYLPWYEKWQGEMKIVDSRDEKLDEIKIQGLRNIITACHEKKVRLVIVVSPTYKKYINNYSPTIKLAAQIADSSNVPFWNYINDTTYLNHKPYFTDIRHMNDGGARVFTADIIKRLKALQ